LGAREPRRHGTTENKDGKKESGNAHTPHFDKTGAESQRSHSRTLYDLHHRPAKRQAVGAPRPGSAHTSGTRIYLNLSHYSRFSRPCQTRKIRSVSASRRWA
jgi:hypothetical protein